MINIVLYEPEIPQNTGNIARLCACTGSSLYLVGKLGFALTDKYTKRAGMDYWESVDLHKVNSMDDMFKQFPDGRFFYLTTEIYRYYISRRRLYCFRAGIKRSSAGICNSRKCNYNTDGRRTAQFKFIKFCCNSSL